MALGSLDEVSGQDGGACDAGIVEPLCETELADLRTESTEVPRRCDPVDERLSKLVYHATPENDPSEVEKCGCVADGERQRVDGVDHQLLGNLVTLVQSLGEMAGFDRPGPRQVHQGGRAARGGEGPSPTLDAGPPGVGLEVASATAPHGSPPGRTVT